MCFAASGKYSEPDLKDTRYLAKFEDELGIRSQGFCSQTCAVAWFKSRGGGARLIFIDETHDGIVPRHLTRRKVHANAL